MTSQREYLKGDRYAYAVIFFNTFIKNQSWNFLIKKEYLSNISLVSNVGLTQIEQTQVDPFSNGWRIGNRVKAGPSRQQFADGPEVSVPRHTSLFTKFGRIIKFCSERNFFHSTPSEV